MGECCSWHQQQLYGISVFHYISDTLVMGKRTEQHEGQDDDGDDGVSNSLLHNTILNSDNDQIVVTVNVPV